MPDLEITNSLDLLQNSRNSMTRFPKGGQEFNVLWPETFSKKMAWNVRSRDSMKNGTNFQKDVVKTKKCLIMKISKQVNSFSATLINMLKITKRGRKT